MLKGKTVILAVGGGIAAYKSAELVRRLLDEGARVRVVMTRSAQQFITRLTLQTLSGEPVATDLFDLTQESEIGHIDLADSADVVLVAPATANILGKLAHGIADDLLTTVLLATRAPIVLVPAMNVNMFESPVVQENLQTLGARGFQIVSPDVGSLACGYEGAGRQPDPPVLIEALRGVLSRASSAADGGADPGAVGSSPVSVKSILGQDGLRAGTSRPQARCRGLSDFRAYRIGTSCRGRFSCCGYGRRDGCQCAGAGWASHDCHRGRRRG